MKNIFKMIPDWTLALVAGVLNGVMDSIAWHNSYANYGWLWDVNSWQDLYDHPSPLESLLHTSVNVWHISKWAMLVCFFILIFRNALFPHTFSKKGEWVLYFVFLALFFMIGFQVAYK